jgi:hypothetical protein
MTLIVVLQGVQALYLQFNGLRRNHQYADYVAMDSIFLPLAVLGLLRLPAAPWVTEDYSYADHRDDCRELQDVKMQRLDLRRKRSHTFPTSATSPATDSLADVSDADCKDPHPIRSFYGVAVRALYLLVLTYLFGQSLYYMFRYHLRVVFTITLLLHGIVYIIILGVALSIFCFYIAIGESTSTTIPCINRLWYRLYTIFLILFSIAMVVVSGLETKQNSCGKFTTWPLKYAASQASCLN